VLSLGDKLPTVVLTGVVADLGDPFVTVDTGAPLQAGGLAACGWQPGDGLIDAA
jgi:hypothetical protein